MTDPERAGTERERPTCSDCGMYLDVKEEDDAVVVGCACRTEYFFDWDVQSAEDDGHRFEECPDCGGDLEYPTQADVSCSDCDGLFTHEIRGDRHLLWRFSHEDGMEEVVARVE